MNDIVRWAGLVLAAWCAASSGAGWGASHCQVESRPYRVPVLELYTSEGCNSCPPADRWLSALPGRGVSADRAVLLAFHVDYWNYLGWTDRFSKPAFSARQARVAARTSRGVVYTPQLVLDGGTMRTGRGTQHVEERLRAINAGPAQATIGLDLQSGGGALRVTADVRLTDVTERDDADTWIALYERGLSSRVTAGENAGTVLDHDFVVRELAGPFHFGADGRSRIEQAFAPHTELNPDRTGLAVFVQRRSDGGTLQAVSSYPICGHP